jgi:cytochrome c
MMPTLHAKCGIAVWVVLVGAMLVAENPERGKELFEKRCVGCHALDNEKEGPRLRGVYGRISGTVPSFTYSDALAKAQIKWDDASLDNWLTDPEKLVPNNDMAFRVGSAEERGQIIAYLKRLSNRVQMSVNAARRNGWARS